VLFLESRGSPYFLSDLLSELEKLQLPAILRMKEEGKSGVSQGDKTCYAMHQDV